MNRSRPPGRHEGGMRACGAGGRRGGGVRPRNSRGSGTGGAGTRLHPHIPGRATLPYGLPLRRHPHPPGPHPAPRLRGGAGDRRQPRNAQDHTPCPGGGRLIVPAIAFVEILFWIVSLGLVVNEFTNPVYLISYGGAGFAAGNYVGILLEERLAMGGICVLRVITSEEDRALIDAIRAAGYGVTVVAAEGLHGPCTIFYSVVRRCDLLPIARVVEEMSPPCAFCTVEDVRSTTHGTFPRSGEGTWSGIQRRAVRIGK
ncbi:DUF5698 domain-containing protein [Methanoculleus chikugoensis]|uniref:DUF2179 domain-containing protein n=1 Tax=Methanoculleus chikugoensis TaxID=118126 RepID=UPI0006D0C4B9|nr:DUF5698 domain-containing protein [Methanoculleus chikugoensis]